MKWTPAAQISASPVAGEPSLAGIRLGSGLYLAYKGTDNVIRWRIYNGTDWESEHTAQAPDGTALTTAPNASPAVAHVYLPWEVPQQPMLYGAFVSADGSLAIYWLNFGGRWVKTNLLDDSLNPVVGRPSMAWIPNSKTADYPGQFYLGARRKDEGIYWMERTYVGQLNGSPHIGRAAYFDNVWFKGSAIQFMESTTGSVPQLWAASTFVTKDNTIFFRPRADGVVDTTYRNYDDWQPLGWGLCRFMVNPDGSESNPVRCMARPW